MAHINFLIHPQLVADSHELLEWQHCHLRLHKNASLPWLIIIPQSQQIEFYDLSDELQLKVTGISQIVGHYFKSKFDTEKINFAAIGNVVQQLHVHVIGRHSKDPLWPDVVWGNELPKKSYPDQKLVHIRTELLALLEQQG